MLIEADTILYAQWEEHPILSVSVSGHGETSAEYFQPDSEQASLIDVQPDSSVQLIAQYGSTVHITWKASPNWKISTVRINGVDTPLKDENEAPLSSYVIENIEDDTYIEITYIPLMEVPETGNMGSNLLAVTGLTLLIVSLAVILFRRRSHTRKLTI